ncbi:hypothetical protein [Plantactinospora sp. WMMB782]
MSGELSDGWKLILTLAVILFGVASPFLFGWLVSRDSPADRHGRGGRS